MNENEIRNHAVSSLCQIIPWFRSIAYKSFNNKDFDLTRIQLHMVMALYYHGTVSMGTLAKLVGTSNEQVTRAAIKLEEKEFIIRKQDELNRRVVNISLSEKAKEIVSNTEQKYIENIERRFKGITIEEMKKVAECADYIKSILYKVENE